MAAQCRAITHSGSRCASPVLADSTWCWVHDPASAEARREASRKGGHARSNARRAEKLLPDPLSIEELDGRLGQLLLATIEGTVPPQVATAAAGIARAIITVRAAGELETRVRELEARAGWRRSA